MAFPSTVWAQLSSPNSPIGSVPFVGTDGATIGTDVANFFYTGPGGNTDGTKLEGQLTVAKGLRVGYQSRTSTPGSVTINEISGRATIPAGSSFINVTCDKVFSSSIVMVQLLNADTTLIRIVPVAIDGTITFSGNAAATANVTFSFIIFNVVT